MCRLFQLKNSRHSAVRALTRNLHPHHNPPQNLRQSQRLQVSRRQSLNPKSAPQSRFSRNRSQNLNPRRSQSQRHNQSLSQSRSRHQQA